MLLVEPSSIHHLQTLLVGKEKFFDRFGLTVAEDYFFKFCFSILSDFQNFG